eukprot:TRINITY_DN160_c0_g2_i2.p1 TRINITY_DN160_c0_g2~~TRINITY_DN160_c0_g2_i2.p1  ORF type:complete len:220 (-),score=48.14 TRINITY_DN160_c0_g2_i2:49-708(-)
MDLRSVDIHELIEKLTFISVPINDYSRTKDGHPIMYCRVDGYQPSKIGIQTLRAIFLLSIETLQLNVEDQSGGVSFVTDCAGIGWSNWEPSVEKIMTEAFTNAIPVRLKSMIMYNINWLFKIIFKIVKPWLPKKIQNRMHIVSVDQLEQYFPDDSLNFPIIAGGDLDVYSDEILAPFYELTEKVYNRYVEILNQYEEEHGPPPQIDTKNKKKKKTLKKK